MWPEEPKFLIVQADTEQALALAEVLQVKLEVHAEVMIIDLTNYGQLRQSIIDLSPDLVILGDFADFELEEKIIRAIEHTALLAFRINPYAIVVQQVLKASELMVVGVDVQYDLSKPIEDLIDKICDID
jgi:hypothetical protein